MPMEKGFWKKIDTAKLSQAETAKCTAYKNAIDGKKSMEDREKARKAFVEELSKRFQKNGKIEDGKELTVMYNKRFLSIGFKVKTAPEFFDMGDP